MVKKALVVGGTGPTGPLIIRGLQERGYAPTMLNRGSRVLPELADIELIKADPHFAETFAAAVQGHQYDLVIATYGRLRVMIDTLREVTDRVVSVGGTAYADRGGRPAHEDSPRYTENKIVAKIVETEQALLAAHDAGYFNWSHLRYPNLWGSRQLAPREWSIIRRLKDGRRTIPIADGGLTLESKAYVENAAHAVLLTVDKPDESAGQQYNVCDDETPSDATRVRDLARAFGVDDVQLLSLPEAATGPASFWGIGRDLSFSREGRPPRTVHKLLSNTKMREQLGYEDLVPYEEAVRRTVEWYVQNPADARDEEQLSDPFDYAAEDAYADALASFVDDTRAIPFAGVEYVHQYSHPKKPSDVA
ncbi:NAD-dependent epimerase/dehydratase family protein [Nocardioides zeae]|uniref:Nucleoside-diphosphate-sugar epimerase n=1 Tax=Nocardioides zeae TaxID=1457234 RepID=A0AAJ1U0E4_9ACTN|nr:NAD-dependent epimerase/dehydratase family protein [Nocardioides zeae]MDQ1105691.1 nucleoside-diphosphate-sugar epimerase [Nocardioides zeae]